MYKPALTWGIILGALGVVLGAFGAHSLKPLLLQHDQLPIYEKAVMYQFYHAFALLATGLIHGAFPNKRVRWAGTFFWLGVLLFSGSLYALTIFKIKGVVGLSGIGAVTPIGGLCFVIGWLSLLLGIYKKPVA